MRLLRKQSAIKPPFIIFILALLTLQVYSTGSQFSIPLTPLLNCSMVKGRVQGPLNRRGGRGGRGGRGKGVKDNPAQTIITTSRDSENGDDITEELFVIKNGKEGTEVDSSTRFFPFKGGKGRGLSRRLARRGPRHRQSIQGVFLVNAT